jgi:hypothetical protein
MRIISFDKDSHCERNTNRSDELEQRATRRDVTCPPDTHADVLLGSGSHQSAIKQIHQCHTYTTRHDHAHGACTWPTRVANCVCEAKDDAHSHARDKVGQK